MMPGVRVKPLTEAEFTNMVIDFARLHGWLCAHFRPAMNRRGKWSTAVQGDGVGFVDLVMIRGDVLIGAELKIGKRKPTPEQLRWIDAFRRSVRCYVWRPTDWDEIEEVLK